ncbi:diguanylate cyclase [Ectopseudomonas mendocina]|nr:diguanylate cyclase [Pseudomonas mendocina]
MPQSSCRSAWVMETLYFSPLLLGINLMLGCAIASTALWYFARPYCGPGVWMSGAWTLNLGIWLFIGYMASGNPLLNIAGNSLQLAGEALLMVGVFRFLGLPPPWWTVPASAGAMSLVMSWHWFVAPINTEFVVTFYALIGGLLPIQACRALWVAREEPELRGVRRFVALAFAGFALITLLRALLGLIDGLQGIEHVDVTRSVPYLLPYNFGIPLWVIGLVGLALMTMRRILADSRRHAEQAEDSAERFERLMRITQAGVVVLERGRIVDANPMLETLFARSREHLLSADLHSLFAPAEQTRIEELLGRADGQPHDLEALRDAVPFAAEISIAQLREDGRQVAEIRDVSRRKALEQQLLHLATTDPLTQALNRRAFEERAGQALQRSQRQDLPLCLAMLDLDHFKQVNDRHGHTTGDAVLREFSLLCRHQARATDLFARVGGEEFILLLPDSDLDAAAQGLERLRTNLAESNLQGLRISVSIGLAEWRPDETLEQLQQRADTALYAAKVAGRDRLMRAT